MFYHISVQKNLDIFVSVIPAVLFFKNYFQKTRLLGYLELDSQVAYATDTIASARARQP